MRGLIIALGLAGALAAVAPAAWGQDSQRPVDAPAAAPVSDTPSSSPAAAPAEAPAVAATKDETAVVSTSSFRALVQLFVLAAILESAMAIVFNWRPFLQIFDSRGVKTLVSLAAALVLVVSFKLDVVADLMRAYDAGAPKSTALSLLITAMVVAGGSSGVNNLLRLLGVRSIVAPEDRAPKPNEDEAWLAVALTDRGKAVGLVTVEVQEGDKDYAAAGVISGVSRPPTFVNYFVNDFGRFPKSGGFSVKPGVPCKVRLKARDANGADIYSTTVWGPQALRPGAQVDLELKL